MIKWTITAPDGRVFEQVGSLHQILKSHGLSGADKGIRIEWTVA